MILLLNGYAGSGKDTIADWICHKYPNFNKISIATYLKEYVSKLYNFDVKLCNTQQGKKTIIIDNKTVRDLLIKESLLLKRENGENYFIDSIVNHIKSLPNKSYYVIPDLRFKHEIKKIQTELHATHSLVTINVINNRVTPLKDQSEHDLDSFSFDYVINNSKDLNYLKNQLYTRFNFILDSSN